MLPDDPPTPATAPHWRGFHHIALVTPDLDATITFYTEVLGMRLTGVFPATERSGRHCFIKPGETETHGIHFFEQPAAQLFPYPADIPRVVVPGALQHIAFALPSRADGLALRERLAALQVPTTDINTLGPIQNMLFRDNHGLLLEAAWPAEDR
jgi:catechol 2,3-dioxygenase-like lactoylglutathione lyase family enzyme